MTNMGEYLEAIVGSVFIRHRGCLIDPRGDGFYWADTRFDTLEKAKEEIDRCYEIISNSNIKNVNQQEKNPDQGS
jgi:hypothetical protein